MCIDSIKYWYISMIQKLKLKSYKLNIGTFANTHILKYN